MIDGVRVVRESLDGEQSWNDFAVACGASYLCSHSYIRAQGLRYRLLIVGVYLDQVKIAQCAVARAYRPNKAGRFLDGLQLLPQYSHLWVPIMQLVLEHLGDGSYFYGSKWNIEPNRFAYIHNVRTETIAQFVIQVVDFANWSSWQAYEKAISRNVVRNAAKALKTDPATAIMIAYGLRAVPDVISYVRMRLRMRERKHLEQINAASLIIRYVGRMLLMGSHAFTAKVRHAGRIVAFLSGVEFGSDTYYLDGASQTDNGGAAWYLTLDMLRRAWRPQGKFYFSHYERDHDWAGKANIMRSRHHCRVSEFPGDLLLVHFAAASAPSLTELTS